MKKVNFISLVAIVIAAVTLTCLIAATGISTATAFLAFELIVVIIAIAFPDNAKRCNK